MIGALSRAYDRFRGSGEAAVTIPSMDGAFRPNHVLEKATTLVEIAAPDNIAFDGRRVLFSSGSSLFELSEGPKPRPEKITDYENVISAIGADPTGVLAIGLAGGEIVLVGGAKDGDRLYEVEGRALRCPTALHFLGPEALLVCLGSQANTPSEWTRDLLDGNCSGSVWRIDLRNGKARCLADALAWPGGVVAAPDGRIVVAEAWRHRLIEISSGHTQSLLSEIPGYPARLTHSPQGGYWLSVFAPRSQLVEFVLREPQFRQRMIREIDPRFWVAPSLHSARDYREPLQAGAIKQLGELKPWAPSRSYGLIVGLDPDFTPARSFHSRADGKRHGITSCLERGDRLLLTSKGGNAILSLEQARNGESRA